MSPSWRPTPGAWRTLGTAVLLALIGSSALGQQATSAGPSPQPVAGRNVNVIGGPTWVRPSPFEIVGDPWRNQTVEPYFDISPRNPAVLVASGVDYRLVDIDGVAGGVHPDSWNMIAQSRDGGLTWVSRPHRGHLLDPAPSFLHKYEFTTDPMVRFGAAGVMYHVGLASNRADNSTNAIYFTTWIHLNNLEYDPEPVKMTTLGGEIGTGGGGTYLDRPHLTVGEPAGRTCHYDVPVEVFDAATGAARTDTVPQDVPCTPAYVAYAAFLGPGPYSTVPTTNTRSKVMFSKTVNGGKGWTRPLMIDEQVSAISQGVQVVKIPKSRKVMVFWRRGKVIKQFDAIMMAVSNDDGDTFSKATVLADVCPFDQDTTATRMRFKTMPSAAAGNGRAYVVWADRRTNGACDPTGSQFGRVMIATTSGGKPIVTKLVDTAPVAGNQLFPTVAVSAGRVHVSWYDFRNDAFVTENQSVQPRQHMPVIDEMPSIDPATGHPIDGSARHTADMFAAEAAEADLAFGAPFQLSQYVWGKERDGTERAQLQWNPVLARNFNKMRVPFHGDYNSAQGEWIVPVDPVNAPNSWGVNLGDPNVPRLPIFHDVWTDARNMRLVPREPYGTDPIGSIPRPFTPPSQVGAPLWDPATGSTSLYDPTQSRLECVEDSVGTKNLDIYTARTTPGLYVFAPWNNKTLGRQTYPNPDGTYLVQRAFPIVLENTGTSPRAMRLSIANQPDDCPNSEVPKEVCRASFEQFAPTESVDVSVAAQSMAARTVFVTSTSFRQAIRIDVRELDQAGNDILDGLRTTLFLNPDPTAPDNLLQPGQVDQQFDIKYYEHHKIDITFAGAQDINFQGVNGEGLSDAQTGQAWGDPWAYPRWENPRWENPRWENPRWENPRWENPRWENPRWENPRWENASYGDVSSRHVTARVESRGCRSANEANEKCSNTFSTYDANAYVAGADPSLEFQLIAYKLYTTPAVSGCDPGLVGHTQVLVNIPDYRVNEAAAAAGAGPLANGSAQNATFVLGPDETAYIVLVAFDPTSPTFVDSKLPPASVQFSVTPQAVDTSEYLTYVVCESPGDCVAPPVPGPVVSFGIDGTPLPAGTIGVAYLHALSAFGGVPPYTWAATGLPGALALSSAGEISGVPNEVGVFGVTVTAADSASHVASRQFALTIGGSAVYVADGPPLAGLGQVVRIGAVGSSSVFASLASLSGDAADITRESAGSFLVVDSRAKRLLRLDTAGNVTTLVDFTTSPTYPTDPIAVAADSLGRIYVADNDLDKIFQLSYDGIEGIWSSTSFDLPGPSPDLLQDIDLAVDGNGDLVVAYDDYGGLGGGTAILRVSWPTTTPVVTQVLTPPSTPPLSATLPRRMGGLGIDAAGDYIVADYNPYPGFDTTPVVFRIAPDGSTLTVVAQSDALRGHMSDLEVDFADGSYVVAINGVAGGPTRVVRVSPNADDPGAATVSTILAGAPLTFANGVTVVQ